MHDGTVTLELTADDTPKEGKPELRCHINTKLTVWCNVGSK